MNKSLILQFENNTRKWTNNFKFGAICPIVGKNSVKYYTWLLL